MIKVTFTDEIEIITSTEHLYQWDVGQVLEIDGLNVGTPMVHFGVKGDATGYAVQSQIVDGKLRCGIPDTVLQSGKQIIVYIYVSAGASKYTDRVILIPVIERNKPSNYRTVNMDEVTETQSFFDSMVDRLTSLEKRVPISFWVGTQAEYNKIEQKQNNCLYIITDDIIADYIVEQGTKEVNGATWEYEKWNSGTYKCWCIKTYSIYIQDGGYTRLPFETDFPIEFVGTPNVQAMSASQLGANHIISSVDLDGTSIISLRLYSTTAATTVSGNMFFQVVGRWK